MHATTVRRSPENAPYPSGTCRREGARVPAERPAATARQPRRGQCSCGPGVAGSRRRASTGAAPEARWHQATTARPRPELPPATYDGRRHALTCQLPRPAGRRRAAQARGEARDAPAALGERVLVGGEGEAHVAAPLGPKASMGSTETPSVASRRSANSVAEMPVARTSSMMNMPPIGMWQRRPAWPSMRATTRRAALVGRAHLGGRRVGLAQRGRRRVRDERRRAEEHAVEQQHEARLELLGHDGPARAPAGHRVRLREARDAGDALLGALDREHARVRAAAEEQRAVDLVGDQPEVVLTADLAERRERLGGQGTRRSGCAASSARSRACAR